MQPFSCGEIFCGAGGLSRGFHATGFRSLFANDIWDEALSTYLQNFDDGNPGSGEAAMAIVPLPGSIDDVDPRPLASLAEQRSHDGSLDVLLGGPPCQGFSLNSHIRSADDPRNHLFRHYVRILRGLAPKFLVLENVPGMLSLAGGAFFQELIASLADSSAPVHYEVRYKILNAAHYGVPQDRFSDRRSWHPRRHCWGNRACRTTRAKTLFAGSGAFQGGARAHLSCCYRF